MSRPTEQMQRGRHNGEVSPEQLEADIDRTREEMSHTLDELGRRLSPGEIVDQALHYLRGPNEFVSNLGETVQRNPMPVLLTGIGLAWMIAAGRSGSVPRGGQVSGGMGQKLGEAKGKIGEAKGRAQEAMESTRGQLEGQAQKATETAARVSESMRQQGQRAKGSMQSMMRDQPLVVGALGVALGAALGAGLPTTRTERQTMGRKGEQLLRAGQEKAQELSEKGQRVAERATESVKEEAKRQGAGPEKGEPTLHS